MSPADHTRLEALPAHVLLGLTAFLEARSEPIQGIIAVMYTVINRVTKKHRGHSVPQCCLAAQQYSCWNDHDPQQALGLRLATMLTQHDSLEHEPDAIVLTTCLSLATSVVHQHPWPIPDPSRSATHYFNPDRVSHIPAWSKPETGAIMTTQIGRHTFFRNVA